MGAASPLGGVGGWFLPIDPEVEKKEKKKPRNCYQQSGAMFGKRSD